MTEPPHNNQNQWGPLWPLGEALRFLTIIPVPGMPPMSEASIARAIRFFPLAGAVIGLLLAVVGLIANTFWVVPIHAVIIVVAWGILTAGLHLDGVSDTFDAVMSWRPRERKLEIMKDSRVGAMGAMALIAILVLKIAFISTTGTGWLQAIILAPVLGRWADIYGIFWFPAAREGGLGRNFQSQVQRSDFTTATIITLVLALLLAGIQGLIAFFVVWGATHLIARWWTKDLGGLTGDTYGALCEIAEVITLAALSASL
ncbi:MAG: adenosylcobinamide-GDP ribazoletransferase [Chloroflexota bacterium]